MGNEGALGVTQLLNQHNNILGELLYGVVCLVWRSLCIPVPSHVNGHYVIVLAELRDLMTPREPELPGAVEEVRTEGMRGRDDIEREKEEWRSYSL